MKSKVRAIQNRDLNGALVSQQASVLREQILPPLDEPKGSEHVPCCRPKPDSMGQGAAPCIIHCKEHSPSFNRSLTGMPHGFSNQNQSPDIADYAFGDFSVSPRERMLTRSGVPIVVQPKAFDALLALVRRADFLVSKEELMKHLWPSVHVAEANLTNIIVSLRKALGPESIQTVSKHGYRFTLPVTGEPGVPQISYDRFARAKELTRQRSIQSTTRARELYWICLAENPGFVAAWAWLGRCCWFLAKFGPEQAPNVDLADASLRRALAIDSDLPEAHQFYTAIQAETGRSEDAVQRLMKRLELHPGEAESFVGLVHALRFQGLLDLSIEAHKRASELDPTLITSVAHTWFLKGEYPAAIETYGGRARYYLDAASWAALGEKKRAVTLLTERLRDQSLSKLMTALLSSLLAVLESRSEDVHREIENVDASLDPEIVVYFARHSPKQGRPDKAMEKLKEALAAGFIVAPSTLTSDSWFQPLHEHPDFERLLHSMDARIRQSALSPIVVKTLGL